MSNQQAIECSNNPCNCTVTGAVNAEAFCSDFCKEADDAEEMDFCLCGHPPCDTE